MIRGDYLWILLGMGLVTYLPRLLPLLAFSKKALPEKLQQWLRLIPAAILAALVAPDLFADSAPRHLNLLRPELLAAVPTVLVAQRTRSLGLAVLSGMLVYWLAGRL